MHNPILMQNKTSKILGVTINRTVYNRKIYSKYIQI